MKIESVEQTYSAGKYKYVLIFYSVTFLLSELIRALDATNSIVYEPAHVLFGDFKYLDFYLGYGVPAIYCLIFVIITTIAGVRYLIFAPKKKKSTYLYIAIYLSAIIGTSILCYKFFPDFIVSLRGGYDIAESNNFTFEREYRRGGGKSLGHYRYTASLYADMEGSTDISAHVLEFFNSRYSERGLQLILSPYLYNQAKELTSYNPLSLQAGGSLGADSPIKWEASQKYMLVQFHYLPTSKYLVSYTIVAQYN